MDVDDICDGFGGILCVFCIVFCVDLCDIVCDFVDYYNFCDFVIG